MSALIKVYRDAPPAVKAILKALMAKEASARLAAVKRLVNLDYAPAAAVFLERLDDPSIAVVHELLNALRQLAPGMAQAAGQRVQRDRRPMHVQVGTAFLDNLPHVPHPDDPQANAQLLANPSRVDMETNPALLALHVSNREPAIRAAVCRRLAAILVTDQIGSPLLKHVPNCDRESFLELLAALQAVNPDGASRLAQCLLGDDDMGKAAWTAAADFLADGILSSEELIPIVQEIGGPAVEALAASLARRRFGEMLAECTARVRTANPDERLQLTRIIGLLGKHSPKDDAAVLRDQREACTPIMLSLVADKSGPVRRMTLLALFQMESPSAKTQARAMFKDPDKEVRALAVEILGAIGDPADAPFAFTLLEDREAEVRKEALTAAARLAPNRILSLALGQIVDRDESVARLAASLLDSLPTADLKPELLLSKIRAARRQSASAVLDVILKKFPSRIPEAVQIGLTAGNSETRIVTIDFMLAHALPLHRATIKHLANDRSSDVKRKVLDLLRGRDLTEGLDILTALIRDQNPDVRSRSLDLLAKSGATPETILPLVKPCLRDKEASVRKAAIHAIAQLDPENAQGVCLDRVGDPDDDVVKAALSHLACAPLPETVREALIGHLRKSAHNNGMFILDFILQEAPGQLARAAAAAAASNDQRSKLRVIELIRSGAIENGIALLRRLARDKDDEVSGHAHKTLYDNAPDDQKDDMALEALESHNALIRREALEALAESKAGYDLDVVLPLARDSDNNVRETALGMLAKFDDPRVFVELLSSLNDVSPDVREAAEKLLNSGPDAVPVLTRYEYLRQGSTPVWSLVRDRVEAINRWACRIGQELLGRPVKVQQYRQGVGRTARKGRRDAVEIEVSDYAVTSGHPQGEDIMRGIALHEIGHHLADFGVRGEKAVRGIAHSEGVGEIYDILKDERLERIMRSRRPEWGVYFDRLASHVFSQSMYAYPLDEYAALLGLLPHKAAEDVRAGRLVGSLVEDPDEPGVIKVRLRDADLLRLPGALTPLVAFLSCLRCGFDPALCSDPRIREAIAAVPQNLKDLAHGKVLEAARTIADIIGRSDEHKRREQEWQLLLRRHRQMRREFQKLLQRMRESGHLPDWMRQGAPGIRQNADRPPESPESPPDPRQKGVGGQFLNLGKTLEFDALGMEEKLADDPKRHAAIAATVRKQTRALRGYLERLGKTTVEEFAVRRGSRLDILQARKIVFRPTANLLVHVHDEYRPDLYLGVLIDRSGSMAGDKIERAKAFGILLAESARGLPGISGHVNAFDEDTFYRLGDFRHCAVAALESGGGNNDAGALHKAALLALKSGKKNRLIIMISDGSPTRCSFEALKALVEKLTRHYGIVCAQVAVETMSHIAFPHFVDLSQYPLDEAVSRFGRLLMKLTSDWR